MARPLQEVASSAPSRTLSRLNGNDLDDGETDEGYIHPGAVALFERAPWTRKIPVFGISCEGYGPKCTVALSLCYFLDKGFGRNLINISRFAMFTDRFGIDGTRYQRLSGISSMAFSIKAFSAVLSDTIATFGYTKRWVCAASCVIGGAVTLGFALLPTKPASANPAAGFLFLANLCIANVDILLEGHYSRLMRRHPRSGPALVSWIWWFMLVAALVAACVQGPLSDKKIPQVGPYISSVAQVVCVVFFIFNWYGERPNREERAIDARAALRERAARAKEAGRASTPDSGIVSAEKDLHPERERVSEPACLRDEIVQGTDVAVLEDSLDDELRDEDVDPEIIPLCCGAIEINKGVARDNWRIIAFSAIMTCAVVSMTCVTILGNTMDLLYCAVVVAVVATAGSFLFLPLIIAKANAYFYLHMVLYLNISGAMDSFYMAKKECLADGPHFTYVFYNTVASVIGNIAGIAGVTAFSYIFSKRGYRFTLIVTVLVQIVASIFDIIIVKRWNMHIGIPDHAMYIMGDAIVYEVCYYLAWMPMVLLLSRVCPRGSESMIYAIVAGSGNLGASMAGTLGSILLEKVWPIVSRGVGKCNFDNLPMLLVVGHFLLPLLIIPLSFLLIPSARICDDIDVDGDAVAKKEATKKCAGASVEGETEPIKGADDGEKAKQLK